MVMRLDIGKVVIAALGNEVRLDADRQVECGDPCDMIGIGEINCCILWPLVSASRLWTEHVRQSH